MHPLILKIKKTILKYEMLEPGEKIIVGVSGGADSMALLHALWEIRRDFHLSLVVAHLDHGLRPDAGKDKSFVRKVSSDLGIPFVSRRVDVQVKQKKKNLNLQEAAREARYSFLLETAKTQKATKISLGHTADDQAESVVMRILRGSGTRGLSGIPPVRGGIIIRPLIEVWRQEVEDFLKEKKVIYLTDPSNRSWHFLRNRVRQELLPLLQQYNPQFRQTIVQMADLFRAEEKFWQKILEEKFSSLLRYRKKESFTLDIPSLIAQPLPIRLRSFRYAIEKLVGNLRRVGFSHILAIENLMQNAEPNKSLELPQGLWVAKAYQSLIFSRNQEKIIPFEYSVPGTGYVEIPEIGRGMNFQIKPQKEWGRIKEIPSIALLDYDAIDFPLIIRSFRPGDRSRPLGMEGEKKVKDFFIDRKIPAPQRKKTPLLFHKDHLLWIAGFRIDHQSRLRPETKRVLRVELL